LTRRQVFAALAFAAVASASQVHFNGADQELNEAVSAHIAKHASPTNNSPRANA
jgi:hypothetical protein